MEKKITKTYTGMTEQKKKEIDQEFDKLGKTAEKVCYICKRAEHSRSWIHTFDEKTQMDSAIMEEIRLLPVRAMVGATMIEFSLCEECLKLMDLLKRIDTSPGQEVYCLREGIQEV